MQGIQFDYFRGTEAEQYSFYRVPKALFTAECFREISCEAKILYGLMLDRMGLSVKNRWFDGEDRVYIIFKVEEIAELMGCGTQKAVRLLKELDTENGIGLIEKKRLGLGRPNVIYVKNFMAGGSAMPLEDAGADSGCIGMERGEDALADTNTPESGMGDAPADTYMLENGVEDAPAGTYMLENGREDAPADIYVLESGMGGYAVSCSQNDENHNSGIVKTTNQGYTAPEFQNGENHNSRMVKNINQGYIVPEFQNGENHNSGIVKIINQGYTAPESQNGENHNSRIMKTINQGCTELESQNGENHNSGMVKTTIQEFPKQASNDTDLIKTELSEKDFSDTEPGSHPIPSHPIRPIHARPAGALEEMDIYREIIRGNISYGYFGDDGCSRKGEIDELVELVVDVMMMPDNGVLRIGGVERPAAVVKNRFMKLGHPHIVYVLNCLRKNTSKVENIRSYLLTTLYNAVMTIDNYYRAEVNHDMYGGGA